MANNVKNPPTGAQSHSFLVNTYFGIDSIDTSSSATIQPDTFNSVLSPSSLRDVFTVNLDIKLTISFQTTNPIPSGSLVKFSIF